MSRDEKISILTMSQKGKTVDEIAEALHRSKPAVSRFLSEMADSSVLAKAILKSGAETLATRIVKKASVSESMDVLSRPGMDVLTPHAKSGSSPGFGIQVSVGVGSCGTVVKVEGGSNREQLPAESGTITIPQQIPADTRTGG